MNHYLVRISHDPTEAILATITEQKIDLLKTGFETLKRNKKLQTLSTCNIIAIKTTGEDNLLFTANKKEENMIQNSNSISTKNLVILYDERHQSEIIPDIIRWLGKNNLFKIIILHINTNTDEIQNDSLLGQDKNHEDISIIKYLEDLEYSNFEISNIYLSKETEINSEKTSDLILSALNTLQPDLIVTNTNPEEIVHRFPDTNAIGDYRIGSNVIVRDGQAAGFFRDGLALDTFGQGRHLPGREGDTPNP